MAGILRRAARPLVLLLAAAGASQNHTQSRIEDIVAFEGVGEFLLIGYGLVNGVTDIDGAFSGTLHNNAKVDCVARSSDKIITTANELLEEPIRIRR
jgi:hypothetical protein